MKINSKIIMIFLLYCFCFCFMVGCSSSPRKVSMSQLESDIPQEMKEITINSNKIMPLNIESVEVEKRLTKDIYDEIHCNVVMRNDEYQITGVYVCEYKHYDQGGWSLQDCSLEVNEIVCIADIPSKVKEYMGEECIWIDIDTYRESFCVLNVECRKAGENCYELCYDVDLLNDYECLDIKGTYKQRFELISNGGLSCTWEALDDVSGVIATWDVVGSYKLTESYIEVEAVIDSYNQETKEAHFKSFKYETDYPWIGGENVFDFNDFTIIGSIDGDGNLRFPIQLDTYGYEYMTFTRYGVRGYEMQ